MEYDVHARFHQQFMDRLLPADAMDREGLPAVQFMPAPLEEKSRFGTTAPAAVQPADQLVDENELVPRVGRA